MFNILVSEDDKNIRKLMCEYLKNEGYNVYQAEDGELALDVLDEVHIDLLITDVMMPHLDGYELSESLREAGYELPILMITAKETIDDKRQGFRIGVDDYMVKPIDMEEMLMRVEALLRRVKSASSKTLKIGDTVLSYNEFTVNGAEIPKKEFLLLYKFIASKGKIFSRSELLDEIWGYDTESEMKTIDVHIHKLRERFRDNTDFTIVTVKGLGYKVMTNER